MDNRKELNPEEMEKISGGAFGQYFDWKSVIPKNCPNPNCLHPDFMSRGELEAYGTMEYICMCCDCDFTVDKHGNIKILSNGRR